MGKLHSAGVAVPLLAALITACGSSVYSPGLPAGAGGSDASAGPDGAPLPGSTVDAGATPTGECVGKSCPIPLVAGVTIATTSYDVNGVAMEGSNVFVAARRAGQPGCLVGRIPKLGGNLETVFLGPSDQCHAIAAAAGTVYVAGSVNTGPGFTGISSVPASGGTPAPVHPMNGLALAIGDALYYAENKSISRVNITGGSMEVVQTGRPTILGVAVRGQRLFWLEEENASANPFYTKSRLARGTTSLGGTLTFVAAGLGAGAAIAANPSEVFWTDFNWPACAIARAPIEGGTPGSISIPCTAFGVTVAPAVNYSYLSASLAADATDLIVGIQGRVYRVPL